jgi:hypothetical protein
MRTIRLGIIGGGEDDLHARMVPVMREIVGRT